MKRLVVLTAVAAMMMVGGIAHAAWLAGGSGFGMTDADTMPTGATPTAEVVAGTSDVSVSWIASTMPSDGEPVDGYTVIRYAEGETTGTAATADCDGHVTGIQCVEKDVPAGDWEYTVTPRQGANWIGSESARSSAVNVGVMTIHVAGLSGTRGGGNPWTATATVHVKDGSGNNVEGVTVVGTWSAETGSGILPACITSENGTCEVSFAGDSANTPASATYTVSSLTKTGYAYEPGDSVVTKITIHRNGQPVYTVE